MICLRLPWERCGKPWGTRPPIGAMVARLDGRAAWQGARTERPKLCGNCHVAELHANPADRRITTICEKPLA
jgi:hypothetical protein